MRKIYVYIYSQIHFDWVFINIISIQTSVHIHSYEDENNLSDYITLAAPEKHKARDDSIYGTIWDVIVYTQWGSYFTVMQHRKNHWTVIKLFWCRKCLGKKMWSDWRGRNPIGSLILRKRCFSRWMFPYMERCFSRTERCFTRYLLLLISLRSHFQIHKTQTFS